MMNKFSSTPSTSIEGVGSSYSHTHRREHHDHVSITDEQAVAPQATLNEDDDNREVTQKRKVVKESDSTTSPSETGKTTQFAPGKDVYDLTVVTPTRNERDNVLFLLHILKDALATINVEVIFVDDSDDDTPDLITSYAQQLTSSLFTIRLEHRPKGPERAGGLATAVDLGLKRAQAQYVAVIDADLQHPPELLRVFYDEAIKQDVDLVLASRYIKGGGYSGLDGVSRLMFSVGLKWTAKILFPTQLANVSDPLGGFFLFRRSILNNVTLRPIGYKILLELLIRCRWEDLVEVPYHFQQREHGQSKADMRQGIMALQHMGRLFVEVPRAGRLWKCGGLVVMNMLCAALLIFFANAFPAIWQAINVIVFALLAGLNFFLVSRFIFPAAPVAERIQASPVQDAFTELVEAPEVVQPLKDRSFKSKALMTLSVVVILFAIAWISFTLPGAWIVIGALFIGFSVLTHKNVADQRMMSMLLGMLVGIASIDYLSWRFVVTNWGGWWIAIPLLLAETLGAIHTLGFQYTLWPWRRPLLRLTEDHSQYPIFIFIPTVNEGPEIVEPTVRGAQLARDSYVDNYPHAQVTIVICNDGYVAHNPNWHDMEDLAQRLGVMCVTRKVGGGAKAGNIEHARQQLGATDDALLVIFDADQIAKAEFLVKTTRAFGDPTVGWVQTGQYYSNLDNPVARWADDQQSMFYNLLCPGKAALNSAFICGTNVIIRARALDQIGGLPQDSVTEDFSASIALHSAWRSVFLTDILATGLGPLDLPSYLKQQRRWAMGTLGVLRTHWRQIFLPQKHGLSLAQRIQYFLACTHYISGLRDLIYLVSPMLFIITAIPAVRGSTLNAFLWHFLPYWLVSIAALWYTGRGITGLRGITIGFGSFPVLIESLLSVLLKRKVGFSVTSKRQSSKQSYSHLIVYVLFALAGLFCIALILLSSRRQQASSFISEMWIVYSLCMLGSILWLGVRDIRFQRQSQHVKVVVKQNYPARLRERESSLRPIWNLALAAMLACVIFASADVHPGSTQAASFALNPSATTQPLLGVSLPIQLLQRKPAQLEQALDTRFAIVGRTQDIGDQFQVQWADQLMSQGARPWITLEFGTPGADGAPPPAASLVSIANGLHDADLTRWATSLREYGKPVYLTILLHVDRNWAVSSAVANGGIPQDSARAWKHVQAVFKAAGANNVAWVWAPADPAHDQAYAPPAASISAVLLSMISYPNTKWADPDKTLQAVTTRYPNKPIIVEISAAGSSTQKAAWLTHVGNAVQHTKHVYALIYHEGSPDIHPSVASNKQWSMLSDQSSEHALENIIAGLAHTPNTLHTPSTKIHTID